MHLRSLKEELEAFSQSLGETDTGVDGENDVEVVPTLPPRKKKKAEAENSVSKKVVIEVVDGQSANVRSEEAEFDRYCTTILTQKNVISWRSGEAGWGAIAYTIQYEDGEIPSVVPETFVNFLHPVNRTNKNSFLLREIK